MLVSAVVKLEARREADLPSYLGRAAHALFLSLVEKADTRLAAALHEDSEVKPFTVSDLVGLSLRGRRPAIPPGQAFFLRFTSYEARLSHLLTERVLPHLPPEVELEGAVFAVKEAALDPAEHPWGGQTSYQHLASRGLLGEGGKARMLRLFFASPTTFRSKGRNIPLPMPSLVFGSLVDRWNSFSPVTLPVEVRRYAEECLGIARYDIRTRLVEIAGGKQVGFVGSCSYVALNYDPYWWRLVDLLADFAFYSGVGYKTTMGLGQCRRLEDARPLPDRAGRHSEEGRRPAPGNQRGPGNPEDTCH